MMLLNVAAPAMALALRPQPTLAVSLRSPRFKRFQVLCSDSATTIPQRIAPAIQLTEKASMHLRKLKAENDSLLLRVGVRQGGCSGMSYVMDFEDESKVRPDDSLIEADGINMA